MLMKVKHDIQILLEYYFYSIEFHLRCSSFREILKNTPIGPIRLNILHYLLPPNSLFFSLLYILIPLSFLF